METSLKSIFIAQKELNVNYGIIDFQTRSSYFIINLDVQRIFKSIKLFRFKYKCENSR